MAPVKPGGGKSKKKGKKKGNDRKPLTRSEKWAWYGYDAANSMYYGCVGSLFLPLLILYAARDNACPHNPSYYYTGNDVYFGTQGSRFFQNLSTPCMANYEWCTAKTSKMEDLDESGEYAMGRYCNYMVQWMNASGRYSSDNIWAPYFVNESSPYIKQCNHSKDVTKVAHIFNVANQSNTNTHNVDRLMGPTLPVNSHNVSFAYCLRSLNSFAPSKTSWNNESLLWTQCKALSSQVAATQNGKPLQCFATPNNWTNYPSNRNSAAKTFPPIGSIIDASTINCTLNYGGATNIGRVDFKNTAWRHGAQSVTISIGYDKDTPLTSTTFTYRLYPDRGCMNKVKFGIMEVFDLAFATSLTSIGVAGQVVLFVLFSSFGDYGTYRKSLMMISSWLCAGAMLMIAFLDDSSYYDVYGACFVLITIGFGVGIIMYNSYLPFLVKDAPEVRKLVQEKKKAKEIVAKYNEVQEIMSSAGFFWGYVATVIGVIASMALAFLWSGSPPKLINALTGAVGVYVMIWLVIVQIYLSTRPGQKVPNGGGMITIIQISTSRMYSSISSAYMLPESWKFMLAYFMYSDGYATFVNVGVLMAQAVFQMGASELIFLGLIMPFGAAIGMHASLWIQKKMNWTGERMLMALVSYIAITPIYPVFSLIPGCPFGLRHKIEMYPFVAVLSLSLGCTQSYSRTTFTKLIPPGQEAEFFGLFEISDKGSSWMGPLVVTVVYQLTAELKWSVFYLMFICWAAFFLLSVIDFEKAKQDCNSLKMALRIKRVKRLRQNMGTQKKGIMSFLSIQSFMKGQSATSFLKSEMSRLSSLASQGSSIKSSVGSSISSGASQMSELDSQIVSEIKSELSEMDHSDPRSMLSEDTESMLSSVADPDLDDDEDLGPDEEEELAD